MYVLNDHKPDVRPVNMVQPIDRLHPLARSLNARWKCLGGATGSSRVIDVVNPGPNGKHGTLQSLNPATAWKGANTSDGPAIEITGANQAVACSNFSTTKWAWSCWFLLYEVSGADIHTVMSASVGGIPRICGKRRRKRRR